MCPGRQSWANSWDAVQAGAALAIRAFWRVKQHMEDLSLSVNSVFEIKKISKNPRTPGCKWGGMEKSDNMGINTAPVPTCVRRRRVCSPTCPDSMPAQAAAPLASPTTKPHTSPHVCSSQQLSRPLPVLTPGEGRGALTHFLSPQSRVTWSQNQPHAFPAV